MATKKPAMLKQIAATEERRKMIATRMFCRLVEIYGPFDAFRDAENYVKAGYPKTWVDAWTVVCGTKNFPEDEKFMSMIQDELIAEGKLDEKNRLALATMGLDIRYAVDMNPKLKVTNAKVSNKLKEVRRARAAASAAGWLLTEERIFIERKNFGEFKGDN